MKFLTDAQFPQPLVELLRKLDWDIRTVYEEGMGDEADDSRLIVHSRSLERVFLTFDLLRGESGARVAAELVLHGGKVIQIPQGPDQPLLRALGRLLFHQPEWQRFFASEDGVAVLSDVRNPCKLYTPQEYSQTIHRIARPHFDEYMQHWEEKRTLPPSRRRRSSPPEQSTLFDDAS